jgi:protein-disulfide isomerase
MLKIKTLLVTLLLAVGVCAQDPNVLATSSVRDFTSADLSPETQTAWEQRDASYAQSREQLVTQMVTEIVLDLEAKARNTTSYKLIDEVKAKVAPPTEDEISQTYSSNVQALENKPLSEVRPLVIRFLRREPEERALKAYADELASKYKIAYRNDINSPTLKAGDSLFTVGGRTVTVQEFDNKYRLALYGVKADLVDDVNQELESAILSSLITAEAASLKIDAQSFMAQEVTNKFKTYSDDERDGLENGLRQRLFAKYRVRFLIDPPPPIVQKISVDDDPARGPITAPVTVVMFGDFQCSACSRTHPILQKVISEFPGKVRFVSRDFPLQNIHENAFNAALAAGAANAQGKFFEYGEILYRNQDALDVESLKKYARQIGLNLAQFQLDFASEKIAAEVRHDMAEGVAYGVSGTPTVFVNGVMVRRLTAEDFREAIKNAIGRPVPQAARTARR